MTSRIRSWPRGCAVAAAVALALPAPAKAADPAGPPAATAFDHPADTWYFVGGQLNAIYQFHPGFAAKYTGPNSLRPEHEGAASYVGTLYLGARLPTMTEIFFDGELAAGGGLSKALGIAGFSNLDVVRNPTLSQNPYVGRFFIRQIIPLGGRTVDAQRGHLSMSTKVPEDRIEIKVGKLSTVDSFDANGVGSDSHLQFMSWALDNNGAYDYAADTRGYTYGAVVEFQSRKVGWRIGEMLMPKVANGLDLDWHIDRSRGENIELELRHDLLGGRQGVVRALGYANHAGMGSYREAVDAYLAHRDARPDVTLHRREGRIKYGVGLNLEQEILPVLRTFARAGWSAGAYESFAYTEIDDTVALGGDLRGAWWRRPGDKVGLALATNGLSADHRRYLALGGKGFLLGDGKLTYGRENIVETYYNAALYRGVSAALDMQVIQNPGYNRDRGPVVVLSARGHLEL
ncbi:MAG: carbohydrate porin [Minicystis sp.]